MPFALEKKYRGPDIRPIIHLSFNGWTGHPSAQQTKKLHRDSFTTVF